MRILCLLPSAFCLSAKGRIRLFCLLFFVGGLPTCLPTGMVAYSQTNYGIITYERKTNLYKKYKHWNDVKSWIKESDKNKIDYFVLYFDDSLSCFKPKENDISDKMDWTTSKNTVYQNFKSKKRFSIKEIMREQIYVEDTLFRRKWKITDSKRNISGYNCRKAIWQVNDSTRIYAWYTDDLMVSAGPESFCGLPGLILGLATEDGGVIYFAKTVELIKPKREQLLSPKTKKKIYKSQELKLKLESDFGKEKWGKAMIYENFDMW